MIGAERPSLLSLGRRGSSARRGAPRWNFHKYLLAPDGELAGAWPSQVEPLDHEIVEAIEPLLPTAP